MKILRCIILFLILFLISTPASATTYNFYFSDDATGNAAGTDVGDGNCDAAADCTQVAPCKTLHQAQDCIENLASSGNTLNLYFDRSDTWDASTPNLCGITGPAYGTGGSLCTDWSAGYDAVLVLRDGVTNINAYGTGADPIFDGGITDYETSDPTSGDIDNLAALWICYNNITVQNIKIYRVPHAAIHIKKATADNITITGVEVESAGQEGISNHSLTGVINSSITQCKVHDVQKRYQYGWTSGWSAGIMLDTNTDVLGTKDYYGNIISNCWVYDSAGEGIVVGASYQVGESVIVEKNYIGDTGHTSLLLHNQSYDAGHLIARYNFLYSTTSGKATWGNSWGIAPAHQESADAGYDNSNGLHEVYGNIAIGKAYGIYFNFDPKNHNFDYVGELRVFNNTFKDCTTANIATGSSSYEIDAVYFYNNASIYYDQSGQPHISEGSTTYTPWTIDNNFFWDKVAESYGVVDGDWDTNYKTGDPLLPGEPSINWDDLAAYDTIDFDTHLLPPNNSALASNGKTDTGYEATLLTGGTDFTLLPSNPTFVTGERVDEMGAILPAGADETPPVTQSYGPSGTIPFTTTTEISHVINENGTCKYGATDVAYAAHANTMDGTGGTNMTKTIAVSEGVNTIYTKCIDTATNEQAANTVITFTVQNEATPSGPSPTAMGVGLSGNFSTQ